MKQGSNLRSVKATVSSKRQIVLPAEIRSRDGIHPGQELEIERLNPGVYCLTASNPPKSRGLVDLLLACPEKDWFLTITSESTDRIAPPEW